MKKITTDCPSGRVNAGALHDAVLAEVIRCAEHPTRLQGYIQEAVKRLPDTSAAKSELNAITKRLRDVEKRIEALGAAIEQGAELRSLVERLRAAEQERVTLEAEKRKLEGETLARHRRPDAKKVAELLTQFGELWAEMTEEEKEQAAQLLVDKVEILDKKKGSCRIRISRNSLSHKWNLSEPTARGSDSN